MSMAAMRMRQQGGSGGAGFACYIPDIYLGTHNGTALAQERANRRDPTMKTRAPRVTTLLLRRLALALGRHLRAASAGDERGVHQARVTSRRLRESVPVLA